MGEFRSLTDGPLLMSVSSNAYIAIGCFVLGAAAAFYLSRQSSGDSKKRLSPPSLPDNTIVLEKPWERLAVHVDLPRFGLAVDGERFEGETIARVRQFLAATFEGLQEPVSLAWMEDVPTADHLPKALLNFLSTHQISKRATRVLRCCTQSVVASHALALKRTLTGEMGYNSISGTWVCNVRFLPDDKVQVVHSKQEEGRSFPFVMAWQCSFDIDAAGDLCHEELTLVKLTLDDVDPSQHQRLQKTINAAFD